MWPTLQLLKLDFFPASTLGIISGQLMALLHLSVPYIENSDVREDLRRPSIDPPPSPMITRVYSLKGVSGIDSRKNSRRSALAPISVIMYDLIKYDLNGVPKVN